VEERIVTVSFFFFLFPDSDRGRSKHGAFSCSVMTFLSLFFFPSFSSRSGVDIYFTTTSVVVFDSLYPTEVPVPSSVTVAPFSPPLFFFPTAIYKRHTVA